MIFIIVVIVIVIAVLGGVFYLTPYKQSISKTPSGSQATQNTNQNEVTIKDFSFSPEAITVKAGSSVTFTNKDSVTHTITETNKAFDKEIGPGDTLKITFDKAGTYNYHCSIHPSMKGKVIVQ